MLCAVVAGLKGTPMNFDTKPRTILMTLVGSRGYGLHTDASDYDWRGVCVEPFSSVVGFNGFEQQETKGDNSETTIYSLRKFLKLALKGNPTILEVLFTKGQADWRGIALQKLTPSIVSKQAGKAYLGYMQAQKRKLERGWVESDFNPEMLVQLEPVTGRRKESLEKFGYDTKFAMHALRLGFQGLELLRTGKLVLPIEQGISTTLRGIRAGHSTKEQILLDLTNIEAELKGLLDSSPLPTQPDHKLVEAWMLETYRESWRLDEEKPVQRVRPQEVQVPPPSEDRWR